MHKLWLDKLWNSLVQMSQCILCALFPAAKQEPPLIICPPAQILRVYADGALVARTDRNNQPSAYNVTVPVKGGSRVILALTGSIGEPYGGYRGLPGLRCAPALE